MSSSFVHVSADTYSMYNVSVESYDEGGYYYHNLSRANSELPLYRYGSLESMQRTLFNDTSCLMLSLKLSKIYENSISRLISHMNNQFNPFTKLNKTETPLPIAVRYVSKNGCTYVERFPFEAKVSFSDANRKPYIKPEENISIWIPWTICRVFDESFNINIYYSDHSLESEDDTYFIGAMPNSYGDGRICWGSSLYGYEDLEYNNYNNSSNIELKSLFLRLFNEYFNGGWNTDLGSHLYESIISSLNYSTLDKEKYPMIHRFVAPSKEYINERFQHISAARRKLLSNGISNPANYQNRVKQIAYVLYMLSDFNLTETLDFYKELNTFIFSKSSYLISFREIVKRESSSVDYSRISNGSIDFLTLAKRPDQSQTLLESTQKFEKLNEFLYVYVYNVPGEMRPTSWHVERIKTLLGKVTNRIFNDFIQNHAHDFSNKLLYAVDLQNQTCIKKVVNLHHNVDSSLQWTQLFGEAINIQYNDIYQVAEQSNDPKLQRL